MDAKPSVVTRARIRYGATILSMTASDVNLAKEVYAAALSLPSLTTAEEFNADGFLINGPLYEGSSLTICFKDELVFVAKYLEVKERKSAFEFQSAFRTGEWPPHVTTYFLHESRSGKVFMIMPKYSCSLEQIPSLSDTGIRTCWAEMRDALRAIHDRGFAYMDVKPANICVTFDRHFCLVDLGSVAPFTQRSQSTVPYVPSDVDGARSSAAVDWWMLAMSLAEKGCGENGINVGAARIPTRGELRMHLETHLLADVWSELREILDRLGDP